MNAELRQYADELRRQLARLCDTIEPLTGAQLNWRPDAPNANSLFAIVAHVLGNMEAWVLGIACEQPIRRDRPGEFASSGPSAAPLLTRAKELAGRFDTALGALPPDGLDHMRKPSQEHWGESEAQPITVRWALLHTIEHAAQHYGQAQLTNDLLAQAGVSS